MLSELHILNLKLCSKQSNKNFLLHLMVVPQLSSGWQHNYSTKTRWAGCSNESMYSLVSMVCRFWLRSYHPSQKKLVRYKPGSSFFKEKRLTLTSGWTGCLQTSNVLSSEILAPTTTQRLRSVLAY